MALASLSPFIFLIITCSFNWQPAISDSASICTAISREDIANPNLKYQTNVLSLLSELASESSHSHPPLVGFFNASIGGYPNKAYGYYLCRGDLKPKLCHDCVLDVTQALSDEDLHNECFGFGRYCMVHFSNHSTVYRDDYVLSLGSSGTKVSNYQQYNETLTTTVEGLIREAAMGNWTKPGFETRVVQVSGSREKIYILVQCTPDISALNCSKCLGELYSYLPQCCNGTQGGMVRHANCFMKYDNQSFFGSANHGLMPSFLNLCLTTVLLSMFFFVCIS